MEPARTWIRMDTGLLEDSRFNTASPTAQLLWLRIYLRLARSGGRVPDREALQRLAESEMLPMPSAPLERFTSQDVIYYMHELEHLGLFEEVDGKWTVRNYDKYQIPMDPTGARRKREWRARQKAAKEAAPAKPKEAGPPKAMKPETPPEPPGGWHGAGRTLEEMGVRRPERDN